MNLPNSHLAQADQKKIADYLLNSTHPDNGGKAQFFAALGFTVAGWQVFAAALRQMALSIPVAGSIESTHGHKYIVDGPIQTPSGKTPHIRTVWIIDRGSDAARLVTAYPIEPLEAS